MVVYIENIGENDSMVLISIKMEAKMKLKNKLAGYLAYCEFRKELDEKTLKAYRIDLKQYFNFVSCDEPDKEIIEEYITELH